MQKADLEPSIKHWQDHACRSLLFLPDSCAEHDDELKDVDDAVTEVLAA